MTVARQELLETAAPKDHFVQMYSADSRMLAVNVGFFLYEGFQTGAHGIVIANEPNRVAILAELQRLGTDTIRAQGDSSLLVLDADEVLARFMVDGYPDAELFEKVVGSAVRSAVKASGGAGVRAYGEMVGILWGLGECPAAIRLEQLWNRVRKDVPFSLFCGYPIDVFDTEFDANIVNGLLCAHTHLLQAGPADDLDLAVQRAMDEILGTKVHQLRPNARVLNGFAKLPKGEAMILWLRSNIPDKANEILELARIYYHGAQTA